MHITWILYLTKLGLRILHVRWPVMDMGRRPVGLGKPPSCEVFLKYLSNPYTIKK